MLDEAVRRAPQGDAVVGVTDELPRRLTWAELDAAARRVAGGLQSRGVGPGSRVLLILRNRVEFVVAAAALARLGAVAVPVSVRSAAPEVAYVVAQCDAMGALCEADFCGLLPAPADAPALTLRVAVGGAAGAPYGSPGGSTPAPAGLTDWAALAAAAPLDAVHAAAEEDTATLLYTSGTTGKPKGAMLTHFNIVHSAMHYEACMALGAGERSLVAVPLSHVTGLVAQWWTMVRTAGTVVLLDAFKAGTAVALAARERVTHSVMVPAMYQLCLLHDAFGEHDLSAWRVGAYGGAPMPPATIAALAAKLPRLVPTNCYGATETTSPASVMPAGQGTARPDSVGVAVPCGELSVRDAEGRELPSGQEGEVWIRGPMVVPGYWGNPQATASEFSEGWWHSGDLGRLDAAGYLQVLDRLKDVINRGGYKVFCNEVEAVLAQHPAVAESAVLGMPCPVLGERVRAVVVLREGPAAEGGELAAELARFCAARLSDYKVPEAWSLSAVPLPRNANGKVMKRALRESA
ncbi:MAG: acyl--CoA ligase [Rubrivivax sp.]|nr:acyl--CoA ligase [Rubrivivax sp.]